MGGGPRPGGRPGQGDFASAFSDVFDDLFGDFMGGAARRWRPARSRVARTCATTWASRSKRLSTAAEDHQRADLGRLRRLQRHRRRKRRGTDHLPDLLGAGQGARATGLLHGRTHLPDLPRRGPDDQEPLQGLPRPGPGRKGPLAFRQHPRRGRNGHAHPARRRGRGGNARRSAGRSLHLHRSGPAPDLPARRREPALPGAGLDDRGRAGRRYRGADHRRRPQPGEDPGRLAVGPADAAARARACRCCAATPWATCISSSPSRPR